MDINPLLDFNIFVVTRIFIRIIFILFHFIYLSPSPGSQSVESTEESRELLGLGCSRDAAVELVSSKQTGDSGVATGPCGFSSRSSKCFSISSSLGSCWLIKTNNKRVVLGHKLQKSYGAASDGVGMLFPAFEEILEMSIPILL